MLKGFHRINCLLIFDINVCITLERMYQKKILKIICSTLQSPTDFEVKINKKYLHRFLGEKHLISSGELYKIHTENNLFFFFSRERFMFCNEKSKYRWYPT